MLLTGTFLTFFFQPSMTDVVYHGSYTNLDGVQMSEAYASTLNISFDVRGGLLIRQIHHWAADLFVAGIFAHMLRVFFTGAYRKPREVNWLIGITLFTLGLLEGLFGYSLPDDLLSGAGLRITEGVLQSIPIVGTYLAFFLFGGAYPGHVIIPRLYILHVLVIPGLILALVTAHLFIMTFQKHTQMPGKGRTNANVVGAPVYPYFVAKTGAFFFFTFAAMALAATFAQINPIWLYGPYNPVAISAGSQPDFYMGLLEGSLRIMPAWQWVVFGHTFAFNVFIPALLPLGLIMTGAALWPFLEQWVTGDRREHHLNDRPRNAPTRTAHRDDDGRVLRRAVGRGRQRRHRRPPRYPAVHDYVDRPVRDLRRAVDHLHHHQADLPRPAARRPAHAGARRGDRHHPPAAERRVHRGDRGALGRGARGADCPGRTTRRCRPARSRPRACPRPACAAPSAGCASGMYNVLTESVPLTDGHTNGHGNGHAIERQRPRGSGNGHAAGRGAVRRGRGRGRAARPARARPRRARVTNRGATLTAPERSLRGRQPCLRRFGPVPAVAASCRGRRSRPRSP